MILFKNCIFFVKSLLYTICVLNEKAILPEIQINIKPSQRN